VLHVTCIVRATLAVALAIIRGRPGHHSRSPWPSFTDPELMFILSIAQLLTQLPNLPGDAGPYFIGVAPGIDGFAIAGQGQ